MFGMVLKHIRNKFYLGGNTKWLKYYFTGRKTAWKQINAMNKTKRAVKLTFKKLLSLVMVNLKKLIARALNSVKLNAFNLIDIKRDDFSRSFFYLSSFLLGILML